MKEYRFLKLADDGTKFYFNKKFPSAFLADRWASSKFHAWYKDKVTFRIIFVSEVES